MTKLGNSSSALLQNMTLAEKLAQLTSVMPTSLFGAEGIRAAVATAKIGNGMGFFEPHMGGFPVDAAKLAALNNEAQRFLIEKTRLGIPAIMHVEAINGVNGPTFTQFPTPIALAAGWDPDAVGDMADLTRRQMRSVGLHQALSPVLDIARDARWGRVHETYGEDPYLTSALGVEFVRAMRGTDPRDGAIATGKHFLGYALSEGGLNMASSPISPRDLLEVHARPFAAAIELADLSSVMNSLADWDGVPAAADPRLFRALLRDQMGFTGTVVSDWGSVENILRHHRSAGDIVEAAVLALRAGIDAELPAPIAYGQPLADAIQAGLVEEALVDEAVLRILEQKFELGLFESPFVDEDRATIMDLANEGDELSRRMARQSVTLLKNENRLLPLGDGPVRIAIIGPHALSVDAAFPPYTFPEYTALAKGLAAGAKSSMVGVDDLNTFEPDRAYIDSEVGHLYEMKGDDLARSLYGAVSFSEALKMSLPRASITSVRGTGILETDESFEEALSAAADADVVVLALGGRARWFFGERTEGEGADASDIRLPAVQQELVRRIAELGRPIVGVIFSGRPFALGDVDDAFDALLFGYYGGPHGTRAVAEVVAGRYEPRGRLPYSVPRATGQVPIHSGQRYGSGYRRAPGDWLGGYVDESSRPLYSFGHGLTYTTFEYSELHAPDHLPAGETLALDVTVTNVGDRPGTEIVQLYAHDTASGIARPAQQLVGFHSVSLEPGNATTVRFDLDSAILGYLDIPRERWIVEPGKIELTVASASDTVRLEKSVMLTGATADVTERRRYVTTSSEVREADGAKAPPFQNY
jgi:beta-xylosidase